MQALGGVVSASPNLRGKHGSIFPTQTPLIGGRTGSKKNLPGGGLPPGFTGALPQSAFTAENLPEGRFPVGYEVV